MVAPCASAGQTTAVVHSGSSAQRWTVAGSEAIFGSADKDLRRARTVDGAPGPATVRHLCPRPVAAETSRRKDLTGKSCGAFRKRCPVALLVLGCAAAISRAVHVGAVGGCQADCGGARQAICRADLF